MVVEITIGYCQMHIDVAIEQRGKCPFPHVLNRRIGAVLVAVPIFHFPNFQIAAHHK